VAPSPLTEDLNTGGKKNRSKLNSSIKKVAGHPRREYVDIRRI